MLCLLYSALTRAPHATYEHDLNNMSPTFCAPNVIIVNEYALRYITQWMRLRHNDRKSRRARETEKYRKIVSK